ncbi:lysylphosphatidylglycerol synthase transmembrane domain-containing protein [Longivirga aurantiaca]|uniref:YbhN family protein n=1 Tax=Longivirga aurantiaca TaxID=1837743 RepID=A0ABW1SZ09_9ACTN
MTSEPVGALGPSDPTPEDVDALVGSPPRSLGRRLLSGLLTYGVVALALWYLVKQLRSEGGIGDALALITPAQVALMCVLGVVNLATNWPPIVIALPGLRVREAAVTNTASAALSNTVPEGGAVATALNVAMLRSWGFTIRDITSEILVTGTWSQLTKYVLLSITLGVVVIQGTAPDGAGVWALVLVVLVAIAVVLLLLVLRSERFAVRLGRFVDSFLTRVTSWVRHPSHTRFADDVPRFRTGMVGLLRVCWGRLTVAMVVSLLTAGSILYIACVMQGLGGTVTWALAMTAYGLATFASLLVPTPGGLGVAEVVLTSVLAWAAPESAQAAVLAAVLLYRLATFLVPIPIGLVTYLYWRTSTAWRVDVDSKPVDLSAR